MRINPANATAKVLMNRCRYAHGSVLTVARYPLGDAKIGRLDGRLQVFFLFRSKI